ncbi:MAG: DUF59 domain-containing protein [Planctomycetes bacterium]|nr:DUF59 domain-containing protein [Planctomycetota bacterium]
MLMITEEQVMDSLRRVYDPEIPVNIVDLGLIYEVKVTEETKVYVKMTMTSMGCPTTEWILLDAQRKVKEVQGVTDARIDLTWEPPWDPSRLSEGARLQLGM